MISSVSIFVGLFADKFPSYYNTGIVIIILGGCIATSRGLIMLL